LSLLSVLSVVANSWGQAGATTAPAAKGATTGPGNVLDADRVRDELEVLEAQIEAKRALVRIDESRAEQTKRWRAYYEKLVRERRAVADRMLASQNDDLMLQGHVMAEKADLKLAEIRLKYARQRAAQAGQAADGATQAKEELAVLEPLLDAKRALLKVGESRAQQARQVQAQYEKLSRDSMATEDLVIAAQDDTLLIESMLAWGRADLKLAELRVKNAQRDAADGARAAGSGIRLAELEERLGMAEMRADVLQHEVGRLRRAMYRETQGVR
jgi:hypothetical protein